MNTEHAVDCAGHAADTTTNHGSTLQWAGLTALVLVWIGAAIACALLKLAAIATAHRGRRLFALVFSGRASAQ
jgi:hypothetical protein